jgi:hypothetical protein
MLALLGAGKKRWVPTALAGLAQYALDGVAAYGAAIGSTQVLRGMESSGTRRQPKQARVYNFDGTNDFLVRGAAATLGDFCISMWIMPMNWTGNLVGDSVASDYIRWTSALAMVFRVNNTNTTINLSEPFWCGQLAHASFVRSGTTLTVYKNGVSIGSATVPSNNFSFRRVGTWSGGTLFYRGHMHGLKVYNVNKTAPQVAAIAAEIGTLADTVGCIDYYPMIEESGTVCYDAFSNNDLTITNADTALGGAFHAVSSQLNFNSANIVGFTQSGNVVIPRDEASPTLDAAGGALGNTGRAPNPIAVNVPCLTFDGTGHIAITGLTGSESVTSLGGTSTLSVAAGRVNGTAGTCFGFTLSSGHQFILEEGAGTTVYNVGTGNNGTLTSFPAPWAAKTTAKQSWRVLYGGRLGSSSEFVPGQITGSLCVDGQPKTLAAGKVCADGGLTTVNFNPFSAAENNGLELNTAYSSGNRSQVVPFNTKFQRTQSDGIDRLVTVRTRIAAADLNRMSAFCRLGYSLRRVILSTDFNNWALAEMFKLDSAYAANQTAARLMPITDQTFFVSASGNDTNDGLSAGSPKLTIASCITAAVGVPRILVGAGTFSGAGITKCCLIEGNGAVPTITGATLSTLFTGWRNVRFTSGLGNSAGLLIGDSIQFATTAADANQTSNASLSYWFNCTGDGCTGDVFNYQGSSQGLESGCITGETTANGSGTAGNNASTGHSTTRIARVAGTYRRSPNTIHDVNSTRSVIMGCTVNGGTGFNVGAGASSIASEDVRMWIYGSDVSGGGATNDLDTDTDGQIFVTGTTYNTVKAGSNVTAFTEELE